MARACPEPAVSKPKPSPRRMELMPLEEVHPATRNVKRHDLADLTKSIERFGFNDAVILDERTGKLVSGHGRLEALTAMKAAGKSPPDGVVVRGDAWCVPVQRGWSSRSDAEAEAFLVAANRLVERGGWDFEVLSKVLDDLSQADALEGVGYSREEVERILSRPEVVNGATDALAEWQGMPDFRNAEDPEPFRTLTVHFRNAEDVERFAKAIGQKVPGNVAGLWFPEMVRETPAGKEWTDATP